MTLLELEPQFLKRNDDTHFQEVDTLAEADGIQFVCPKCLENNGMVRAGVHSIVCWAPSVPQTTQPGPGRWNMQGTSFRDLSLVAGSSSVLLTGEGGCHAHFFVTNGEIIGR